MPYFPPFIQDVSGIGGAPVNQYSVALWHGQTTSTSGVATFNVTDDGTSSGNAIFSSILTGTATPQANTSTATSVPNTAVKTISANNKVITVNVTVGTTIGLLGGPTLAFAPDGTVVNGFVVGVLA